MKIKTYALTLLLLTQTLLYQVSLPQLVLCIGDDGHVAFEETDRGEACFIHPPQDKAPVYSAMRIQSIHPATDHCVDIVLDRYLSLAQYKQESRQIKRTAVLLLNRTLPAKYSIRLNSIASDEHSAKHTSGTQIARSIILLI